MVNGGTYSYEYHLKDHLGNTRVAYSDANSDGFIDEDEILQVTDYYPFGMRHEIEGYPNHANQKYLYNGKELQEETGWYDYGFRFYDPALARFTTVDPLTEKNHSQSGFVYAANNPIKYIDFMGLDSVFYNQAGDEINRIEAKGDDTHFLEHKDGNKTIGEGTYYQGLTKESFFGDRGGDGEMFETVDMSTMNSDKKIAETVDEHTKEGETKAGFIKESPEGKHYDYKNTVLGPQADKPIDNSKTAYMYKGILLNRNEAGNVYWGATTEKLGISGTTVVLGVHAFSIIDEGKRDEYGEQIAIFAGRKLYKEQKK